MKDLKQLVIKNSSYLINTKVCPNFTPDYFELSYWTAKNLIFGSAKGRGTTYFVGDEQKYVIRHYLRGGLIGKINKDWFCSLNSQKHRSVNEFYMLNKLEEYGLNVPTPVAAKVTTFLGVLCRYDIIIKYIENTKDVFSILKERNLLDEEIKQIAKLLFDMYKYNIYHSDLNIHNILFDNKGKLWVIDFDKCSFQSKLLTMFNRLNRSLEKEFANGNIKYNNDNKISHFIKKYLDELLNTENNNN